MSSVAQHHFPLIRWQDGEKHLWNPIHRKVLKNRPEERVRLRIIEFLTEAGWSRYRISTEEAIKGLESDAGLRTDVICYNQEFEPQILVECKAENISISGRTAEQIARYNRNVHAPYLLLSNGNQDYWYQIRSDEGVHSLTEVPDILQLPENKPPREFDYWKKRGFVGEKAGPELRRWLEDAMACYLCSSGKATYLQFKKRPSDLDINHYYQVQRVKDAKVAFSFVNTPYGGSRIIGIFNQNGVNRAVIEINLDLVFDDEQPNASVYSEKGISNIDVRGELEELFEHMNSTTFEALSAILWKIIDKVS